MAENKTYNNQSTGTSEVAASYAFPTNRSLLKFILLSIITLGIYGFVTMSNIVEQTNEIASKHDRQKTQHFMLMVLFSALTLGIYNLVWWHVFSNRLGDELKRRKIDYKISAKDYWLWAILGSLILIGPFIFCNKVLKSANLLAADFNAKELSDPMYRGYLNRTAGDASFVKFILISLVTFGIYGVCVISDIVADANVTTGKLGKKRSLDYSLILYVIAPITLLIGFFVWWHRLTSKMKEALLDKQDQTKFGPSTFWIWFVLGSLILVGPCVFFYKFFKAEERLENLYISNAGPKEWAEERTLLLSEAIRRKDSLLLRRNAEKKTLLRITNLKQYFPLKQKGLYVKANDGIDINIYEGETLGLVGESGCGKSTFGRTVLELYPQTDGLTMYYGRSLDEVAPKYVRRTIRRINRLRKKLNDLREKEAVASLAFKSSSADDLSIWSEAFRKANHDADAALTSIASIFGGFITEENRTIMKTIKSSFMKVEKIALRMKRVTKRKIAAESRLADVEFALLEEKNPSDTSKIDKYRRRITRTDLKINTLRQKLKIAHSEINVLREKYKNDPEFQRYEAYRDDGIDLARLTTAEMRDLRSDLQLIFQDPYSSLNPRMTVGQIIGEGMTAHGLYRKGSARMKEAVTKTMEMCGLAPYFIHRYPHQFSGGQRQRIGIARALSTNPKFVICDEAVSALDVSIQSQIINLLQDLKEQKNLTYLFITHDLSVVKYISDRIGVMYLGNMVELSDSQELFDHPLHPYTEALLSAIPTTNADDNRELVILEGDIPSPVNPPKGCKFHTRCKYCTEICTQITPEMKEIRPNHFAACHHILEPYDEKTITANR